MVEHYRPIRFEDQQRLESSLLHSSLDKVDERPGHDSFMYVWKDVLSQTSPETLVYDLDAQARLDILLGVNDYQRATVREKDPPVVTLYSQGTNLVGTPGYNIGNIYKRFMLDDPDHIYIITKNHTIPTQNDRNGMPSRILFDSAIDLSKVRPNISLGRVPIGGGPVETYNLGTKNWQPSGQGEYKIGNVRLGELALPRVYGKQPSQYKV